MKFNEFKPQLTEEQVAEDMLRNFLEGKISKEEMVNYINENQLYEGGLDKVLKLRDLAKNFGGKLYDKGKDFFKGTNRGLQGRPPTGGKGGGSIPKTTAANAGLKTGTAARTVAPYAAGVSAAAAGAAMLDPTKPNSANADDPSDDDSGMNTPAPTQYADDPSDDDSGMNTPAPTQYANDPSDDDSGMNTPAPTPAPAPRQKVAATAYNTRDYDKTLALQKKLIAQGAKIDADGLMGPKTMAAMKAFKNTNPATGGMGPGGAGGVANPKAAGTGMKSTTTPGSKVKTPGPSVTQNPAYNQTGMDDSDMKKPQPKTPGPSVTQNPAYNQTGMDDSDMKKPQPKMPKVFGIGPRVDDPKGGETVKTPFGFSYKTLPKNPNEFDDRN